MFRAQRADRIHGSVIAAEAFLLRYLGEEGDDRLVVVNLGRDFDWVPAADPLAAPPEGADWSVYWSSEDAKYGGWGTRPFDPQTWHIQGQAALVLRALPANTPSN